MQISQTPVTNASYNYAQLLSSALYSITPSALFCANYKFNLFRILRHRYNVRSTNVTQNGVRPCGRVKPDWSGKCSLYLPIRARDKAILNYQKRSLHRYICTLSGIAKNSQRLSSKKIISDISWEISA